MLSNLKNAIKVKERRLYQQERKNIERFKLFQIKFSATLAPTPIKNFPAKESPKLVFVYFNLKSSTVTWTMLLST